MGKKVKFTFFEIINIIYFLVVLVALAYKFGLFQRSLLYYNIFNAFYYIFSLVIFVLAIILLVVLTIKSKKARNDYESFKASKNVAATLNIAITAFIFFAALFRVKYIKQMAFEWYRLMIYIEMIATIINMLVYYYITGKINENNSYYDVQETINKYYYYALIVSVVFGIIVPNLMIHVGIMNTI